ncbi:MAG: glycosyltransferase family 4 protein [Marinirhabdus sp.]|nr:glycosyltransferase family 4 protein [Marinirhabdus sp.]
MQSTKVLMLTSELPPQPGGIGNHAHHLAKTLNENNFELTVLADTRSTDGVEEADFDAKQSYAIHRIKRTNPMVFTYFERLIMANRLLQSHELLLVSGKFPIWIGGILRLWHSKKVFAVIHGTEVATPSIIKQKFTRWCLRRFEAVIAVSNYTKSLVSDWGISNIEVVPNGFVIANNESVTVSRAVPPRLITVGNVTKRKGQKNVIRALPKLLELYPDLQYDVVGIPTEKDSLERYAKSLGVAHAVVFHGKVSDHQKVTLLKQASIFMMLSEPTKSGSVEGFGIAILEANALGVPAIGAKGCGIEDAIETGYSGELVRYDNIEAIVEAVDRILKQYARFSEGAESWSKKFTWNQIIKQYIAILNR